ncbi:hypothetical protein BDN71DRAFT_1437252 [Pleurotus eryngii]|uniref:Uncharacterized protein n=1 Tax=Pleurotus eryngii TaxID=5323 RepID=A0A9P5ZIA3_PLEER|nr:hypothetical protein BDN71DRAFT_1437252 [Pleurotus eryngii]
MKECWKQKINLFEEENKWGVGKEDFAKVFGKAFLEAFTLEMLHTTFEKTGVWPFNPYAISATQMQPMKSSEEGDGDVLRDAEKHVLMQEDVIKGQTAQLIIQNMTLCKLNESLHIKETRKQTDHTVLFEAGRGRHMTSDETIRLKQQMEEAKKRKQDDKEQRKEQREQT